MINFYSNVRKKKFFFYLQIYRRSNCLKIHCEYNFIDGSLSGLTRTDENREVDVGGRCDRSGM